MKYDFGAAAVQTALDSDRFTALTPSQAFQTRLPFVSLQTLTSKQCFCLRDMT